MNDHAYILTSDDEQFEIGWFGWPVALDPDTSKEPLDSNQTQALMVERKKHLAKLVKAYHGKDIYFDDIVTLRLAG